MSKRILRSKEELTTLLNNTVFIFIFIFFHNHLILHPLRNRQIGTISSTLKFALVRGIKAFVVLFFCFPHQLI